MTDTNRRILLIDDTPSIHEDFKKILAGGGGQDGALVDARAALFGGDDAGDSGEEQYELDSAYQGQEGLEKVIASLEEKKPYAMAFVDIRMPPGWDGVQTIKQLWKSDPDLQIVICTAYSDYSWDQTINELGQSDQLLILKKPFDSVEIRQLACAMTGTWNAVQRERELITSLKNKEAEARAYSSSLETMNQALLTAKATSERASEIKTEFLVHLSTEVGANLSSILERFDAEQIAPNLEPIIDSSRDLMGTLSRILDLTKLEHGDEQSEGAEARIVEMCREAIANHEIYSAGKDLQVDLVIPSAVPEAVQCDGPRLRKVLDQLVDNAIRYTPDGGSVKITLSHEPTSDWSRMRLILSVEDSGSGVPEDTAGRIFEPFVGRPGAGLGLALGRELMTLMGGELTYERSPNGGACFRASLEVGNLSGVRMVSE